jgi:hypothetical protein
LDGAVRDLGQVDPWQESLDRDLGQVDPWQESLERSLARRREANRRRARRAGLSQRSQRSLVDRRLAPGPAAVVVLAFLVAILPLALTSRGGHGPAAHATGFRVAGGPTYASTAIPRSVLSRALATNPTPNCQAAVGSSDYVNPLAGAQVKPERVDQGVDYAGTGSLAAIGLARITYVSTHGTGWPGAFVEYRLLDGVDAGCFVFYAEGVTPVAGLHVGQTVAAGQPIATIIQGWTTGIELGWGAGVSTVTYAAARHQWSAHSDAESIASPAGKSFSALIAALGGPAGKVEG